MDVTKKTTTADFNFGAWKMSVCESHILQSEGPERERFEEHLKLPNVPEMIFAKNLLRLEHDAGFGMEFNALDGLKRVNPNEDLLKVAASKAWREARQDCEHINDVIKPFDWTFSTDYKGTLCDNGTCVMVEETDKRIDIEKLKVREKIHFYSDVVLFEDELGDNGLSKLTTKIRVMPSGFFILHRFYLRVDDVLVRINDTRLHYEVENDYILREYTSREKKIPELEVAPALVHDPNEIIDFLPIVTSCYEQLNFPAKKS